MGLDGVGAEDFLDGLVDGGVVPFFDGGDVVFDVLDVGAIGGEDAGFDAVGDGHAAGFCYVAVFIDGALHDAGVEEAAVLFGRVDTTVDVDFFGAALAAFAAEGFPNF